MFGDDPDPTVTTVRVGSGTISDTHARGLLELVGCAEGLELREEKRERPGDYFRRPKASDVRPTILSLWLSVGASNGLRTR